MNEDPKPEDHRVRVAARRRQQMLAKLWLAAVRVMARSGPEGMTVDNVILDAQVSRGTFYKYYDAPASLISAAGVELAEDLILSVSPALQTLQFTWGCRPFTICSDSKIFGPGLARRKLRVSVSTGTGLSLRFTGFRVPLITSSSMPALSVCAAAIAGRNKIRKDVFSLYENMVSGSKSILFCL